MIGPIIGLVLAVAVAAGAALYVRRQQQQSERGRAEAEAQVVEKRSSLDQERKAILLEAKEEALRIRAEMEADLRERRAEVGRLEQRVAHREDNLDRRRRELDAREGRLAQRETDLTALETTAEQTRTAALQELERVSSLNQEEARTEMLTMLETELSGEIADKIKAAGERVREEADVHAREVLITAMQRYASDQAGESSVTVVHLPGDDMKGRIIGREGRNIRALEAATGVDVIIDDTPEAVVLSGFDPVRREVARLTLQKLTADGRIHPARIEETVARSRADVQSRIKEAGEQACFELGLQSVHPELVKLLGTLMFRTANGQNVLTHSKEVGALCGMIAAELGADETEAKEIGLFHDIGKAVEHHVEGSHAIVGGEILTRLGRPANVIHAVRAHHYDEEPRTVGAFALMAADAISVARPGAQRDTLAAHIKRLERLESIANEFDGVERTFAVQAGKEVRVMVKPTQIDDAKAVVMARDIAKRIHNEMGQAGQVKVSVLRETRSVEYAR